MASGEPAGKERLTKGRLKSASNEFDVESIHTLHLDHQDLSDISAISECLGLERLDISFNSITRLHALSGLSMLQVLDLSANRIVSLDGLNSLDSLKKLNVAGNLISGIISIYPLRSLQNLVHLRFHDSIKDLTNPLCISQTYKHDVTELLPRLLSLDGDILKGQGADFFKLLSKMESELDKGSTTMGPTKTTPLPPKIPDDFFTISWNHNLDGDSFCGQLWSQVEDFRLLDDKSEQLIKKAKGMLEKNEKV